MKVVAKPVSVAVSEFQESRSWISFRRKKAEKTYFKVFTGAFRERLVCDISASQVEDLLNSKKWAPKTRNDFLGTISCFYSYAQLRGWSARGSNPTTDIKRLKTVRGDIKIFAVEDLRQMFAKLEVRNPELIPCMAIWCFAGIRKDEISRLTWVQIHQALSSGFIDLTAKQTKTGRARIVPVTPNLKAWLLKYSKPDGFVLPQRWPQVAGSWNYPIPICSNT
ncbi:MAG: integrase family protein [Verrucomicrobiales bacterium]|jgi:integrase|nr:integrase family protein [Verrucomicrobiales bacterium]